jgi:hypothetical protein
MPYLRLWLYLHRKNSIYKTINHLGSDLPRGFIKTEEGWQEKEVFSRWLTCMLVWSLDLYLLFIFCMNFLLIIYNGIVPYFSPSHSLWVSYHDWCVLLLTTSSSFASYCSYSHHHLPRIVHIRKFHLPLILLLIMPHLVMFAFSTSLVFFASNFLPCASFSLIRARIAAFLQGISETEIPDVFRVYFGGADTVVVWMT